MKLTSAEIRLIALSTARNIYKATSGSWSDCMKTGWAAAKALARLLGTNATFMVVFFKETGELRGMEAECLTGSNYAGTGAKRQKPAGVVPVRDLQIGAVRSFRIDRLVGVAC